MRDDDFADEGNSFCDAEAFRGTLYHLATSQIEALFRHRAAHLPALDDRTFLPLLELVLRPFEEFLSDREVEELWDYLYATYYEFRKAADPALTFRGCKAQVRNSLLGPRRLAPNPDKGRRPKKGSRPQGGETASGSV